MEELKKMDEMGLFSDVYEEIEEGLERGLFMARVDLLLIELEEPRNVYELWENFSKQRDLYLLAKENGEKVHEAWVFLHLKDCLIFKNEFPLIGYYVERAMGLRGSPRFVDFVGELLRDLSLEELKSLDYETRAEIKKRGMERVMREEGSLGMYFEEYYGEGVEDFLGFLRAG